MLEKMMHKSGNMLQNGVQMGAKIEKILIKWRFKNTSIFYPPGAGEDGRPGIGGRDLGGSLLVCFNIPTVRH